MELDNFIFAFSLTLIAGLATGIGGVLAFASRRTDNKLLAAGLGFSAGVMLYLSFVEIFPEAKQALEAEYGETKGYLFAVLAFFAGIAISALIDRLVPSCENPHEIHMVEEMDEDSGCRRRHKLHEQRCRRLMRTGVFTALAIMIHNLPEGLITFLAALEDPRLGISLAIAIILHNIPEGIAVSVPVYHATGSRRKALKYSVLSGLSEPIGALVGYALLYPFLNEVVFDLLLAGVAGVMVYISLDELLPTAEECGEHHLCIWGLISGMALMAISLLLFV